MSVIALIPARSGSKGISGKNFRELGGTPLWQHAADCVHRVLREMQQPGVVVLSTDAEWVDVPMHMRRRTEDGPFERHRGAIEPLYLRRPVALGQDDTPMIAVVQHALEQIPGPPDDIIVLLQPTQPLRRPEHVQQAIALLQESGADSVVSVVPLPLTHCPWVQFEIHEADGSLQPWNYLCASGGLDWETVAGFHCRQDLPQTYKRDGTVYAFWRKTVEQHGTIYGQDVRPLLIDPADSCELDTEADWAAVERRWKERHGG